MFCRKKLLSLVALLIVAISVSSCKPEETKESKLEKKRDELVKSKAEAEEWRQMDHIGSADDSYRSCLKKAALREEDPKKCGETKESLLKASRLYQQNADDRINKIRREIKELEQSEPTN
jgi:TPP-dependent pyruvate/acetoin dehydrogenase alpha subunit